MTQTDLYYGTSGPLNAEIMIVGEAWGETESWEKKPFVGGSGQEFTKILTEASISREACLLTNVVAARPPSNELWRFCSPEKGATAEKFLGLRPNDLLRQGVARLWEQIRHTNPKLVIAVGNWALWALTTEARITAGGDGGELTPSGIMDFRGSMLYARKEASPDGHRIPVLPIIHPAAILRDWALRPCTIHDLKTRVPKALRNDWSPRNPPNIRHMPSFTEVTTFLSTTLTRLNLGTKVKLAHDIETRGPYCITCMGFADSAQSAIVIPFIRKDGDYFTSHWSKTEEAQITRLVSSVLGHVNVQIIGQFYQYDSSFIHQYYGVTPFLFHDTHGAQHLLWPGTPKDLGYLSSVYCSYHRYWKDDHKDWDAKSDLNSHFLHNGEDCVRTFEVHERQLEVLRFTNNEARWQRTLARHRLAFEMSRNGILINTNMKAELSMELSYQSQLRIARLTKLVPQALIDEFNGGATFRKKPGQAKTKVLWPNSTAMQKVLFYEILNMAGQRHRKTKALTLDKEAIPKLAARYPWAKAIFDILLELRSIDVFASTFVNARVDPDHRMRTSFNAAGTETFRWSSSINPFDTGGNFQNLPKGKEI